MKGFKLPNMDNEKSVLKTIRLKYETLRQVERLAEKTNISVNRLINECIGFAMKNLDTSELEKDKK